MTVQPAPLRWDLFCRVVDNLGDAAVMWRLARQLSVAHRCRVRLFIDQPAVLQRLVPVAAPDRTVDGVLIRSMPGDGEPAPAPPAAGGAADVVVTGFHAPLPPSYRRAMKPEQPVWINLEYLSAEDWIEGCHRLPSPQPDGLTEHYFYPGFTAGSGGLLREPDLLARRDAFVADAASAQRFLGALGVSRRDDESLASLLCYASAPLADLSRNLAGSNARLHLVVPEGAASGAADAAALIEAGGGRLRISGVPFLAQQDYDQLLWSCDLNFVRGEDSWVRAVWSAKPFIWQVYPQPNDAHLPKLEAFLRLLAPGPLPDAVRWWNAAPGGDVGAMLALVARPSLGSSSLTGLAALACLPDLATRLLDFAATLDPKIPAAQKMGRQL